jgi:cyclopropane-fatty-acyl-phospholipid synthase
VTDPRNFRIVPSKDARIRTTQDLLQMDAYSIALAFVQGAFSIEGDIIAAIELYAERSHPRFWNWWYSILARLAHARARLALADTDNQAVRDIKFHYDRSNEFFQQFLDKRMLYSCDKRMLYSCAHFENSEWSLEDAQTEKLERICTQLRLRSGERFLDVGCGWGGLIAYAAQRFDVEAAGCTLSQQQAEFVRAVAKGVDSKRQISVLKCDYREIEGSFDKIASVGMFEHVGYQLRGYFRKIYALLVEHGLFLNRGILRPSDVGDGPETLFLQRNVFPGGKLVHLADVIREAEGAGFQVLLVENLRPHYALTCRHWVKRLQANEETCCELVGQKTYRTWLLYLAASVVSFERGRTDFAQVLLTKNSRQGR